MKIFPPLKEMKFIPSLKELSLLSYLTSIVVIIFAVHLGPSTIGRQNLEVSILLVILGNQLHTMARKNETLYLDSQNFYSTSSSFFLYFSFSSIWI